MNLLIRLKLWNLNSYDLQGLLYMVNLEVLCFWVILQERHNKNIGLQYMSNGFFVFRLQQLVMNNVSPTCGAIIIVPIVCMALQSVVGLFGCLSCWPANSLTDILDSGVLNKQFLSCVLHLRGLGGICEYSLFLVDQLTGEIILHILR